MSVLASWRAHRARKQAAKQAKAYSDEIDRQIQEDSKNLWRVCDVLLMGYDDCDISTIVRQMKIAHRDGYTHEERIEFRPTIWKGLLEASRNVVQTLRALHVVPTTPASEENWERIMSHPTTFDDTEFSLKPELAEAIRGLCADDVMPELSRNMTETYVNMGRLTLHFCHATRLRGERKKWIHFFEGVTCVVFCASLQDYNEFGNRLRESLFLFESVVNSRLFLQTSIVLFLTGIYELDAKLAELPLEEHFPEYTGGADVHKAAEYILGRFMQANRAHLNVYSHITHVTDTSEIRQVFVAVKETMLQRALRESDIKVVDRVGRDLVAIRSLYVPLICAHRICVLRWQ
ncbi:G-protein alpha subunit [Lactarius psammicola]|nr:G-protein alpha subunit [Lactarius psammicola]